MDHDRDKFEKSFEILSAQGYSDTVIRHWLNPKNFGIKDSGLCDGYSGWNGCPYGDSMAICIKVTDDLIKEATFMSDICIGSVSAASLLTEKVRSMTPAEASGISAARIIDELGGLPEQFIHCADMAKDTLTKAILDYYDKGYRQAPWKKMYRPGG